MVQRYWIATALTLAVSACASVASQDDVGFVQPAPADESVLVVANNYWGEMDVFALNGGTRVRLGSVMTGKTATLKISRDLLARPEVQFQIDPVGPEDAFTFPPISIHPGATVELMVQNSLRMSSYSVY